MDRFDIVRDGVDVTEASVHVSAEDRDVAQRRFLVHVFKVKLPRAEVVVDAVLWTLIRKYLIRMISNFV